MINKEFFKTRKRSILLALVLFLVIAGIFLVSAYVTGKDVANDIQLQWVSHTEYWNNDVASTIIRLADYRGSPYGADSCSVTILYPDKSVFVNGAAMIESTIEGNWYRTDSLVGAPLGTYEQEVICVKGPQTILSSQSFHLNPALEEVNVISQNLNSTTEQLSNKLSNVNLTLHAKVQETGEAVNINIDSAETTLSALMNSIGNELIGDINSTNADLSTQLTEVQISLSGDISDTEANLLLNLDNVNGSISDLLTTTVQPAIELKIEQEIAVLMAQVSEVNISITGIVQSTGEIINVNVDAAETTLTNLINLVETNLISEIDSAEANLDTSLTAVQISLTNSLSNTESTLTSQLTNVNGSIYELLTEIVQPELENLMTQHYNAIMAAVSDIYSDTQWLVSNAMDLEDRAAIDSRFDSLDTGLNKVLQYCSEEVTNSSALCQEIYELGKAIEVLREEQQNHFDILNTTTYNNWQLLSGDITTNINGILFALNIIQEQNQEINETTHQILDEIQGEIRANIIS